MDRLDRLDGAAVNWDVIVPQLLYGGFRLIVTVFLILIPLMILIEWAQARGWVEKLSQSVSRHVKWLGITPGAVLPMMAGLAFGIMYGAGVMIAEAEAGRTSPREVAICALFLSTSHSLIEDTLLFVAVGANGWILIGVRTLAAVLILALFGRVIHKLPETALAT